MRNGHDLVASFRELGLNERDAKRAAGMNSGNTGKIQGFVRWYHREPRAAEEVTRRVNAEFVTSMLERSERRQRKSNKKRHKHRRRFSRTKIRHSPAFAGNY